MRTPQKVATKGKKLLSRFLCTVFAMSQSTSALLIICTFFSIALANTAGISDSYIAFWSIDWLDTKGWHIPSSLLLFINDVLMPIFFFTIGYEVKHEMFAREGSINSIKKALLPLIAATGGVIVPAVIYYLSNQNTAHTSGWAIPTATDIAFSLAAVSILSTKIPNAAKVFLMALAIFDDVIAVIIIALFYGDDHVQWTYMALAVGLCALLYALSHQNKIKKGAWVIGCMILLSIGIWYVFLRTGLHPTLAGVIVAFLLDNNDSKRPFALLHPVVFFGVLPLFVLSNAAIYIDSTAIYQMMSPLSLGIILGLVVGKPLGIVAFSWISSQFRFTSLPDQMNIIHLIGLGFLAGIGFTMSILITNLSFDDGLVINLGKLSVMIASMLAGLIGVTFIHFFSRKP